MFNEEKTVKWLKKKFELIKDVLKAENVISLGSTSMNFIKSSLGASSAENDSIEEAALGIISEYISHDLIEKLDHYYGISEKMKEPNQKRKLEVVASDSDRKRIKIEEQENIQDATTKNVKAPPKITTKSKALEKAAKGSKSISSFFAKK